MSEKSANGILSTTIEKVRNLVDVSTIIGEPINLPDGLTIIPISKVTYGFASGGSDFPSKNNVELFGGAGGAGITINPVAFLVIKDGEVSIRHIVSNDNAAERAVTMIPEMFDKVVNLADKLKKDKDQPAEEVTAE
ncbi:MAG: sporulation protein YtfJ [Ruminococcaceae bacterium]|nr:sporulation protein YtfJ [Oscillospiraceae bacterium]